MAIDTLINPLASDVAFRLAEAERVLTPALLIDCDRVQHNIATTVQLLGGDVGHSVTSLNVMQAPSRSS